jgi:hypothetical protein
MNENNFNILFEKIGHIEATQKGIYRLLERIEDNAQQVETRLQNVEKQAVRLMTLSGICAFIVTSGSTLIAKFLKSHV